VSKNSVLKSAKTILKSAKSTQKMSEAKKSQISIDLVSKKKKDKGVEKQKQTGNTASRAFPSYSKAFVTNLRDSGVTYLRDSEGAKAIAIKLKMTW